jgi:Zn-dependent protease
MLWVAAAGPASNFMMALFWALMIKLSVTLPNVYSEPMALMGQAGVLINVVLMVLNLLPLPPLDGGRIAVSLLPNHMAYKYAQVERYGLIILIVLLATGILGRIMDPFIDAVIQIIQFIF